MSEFWEYPIEAPWTKDVSTERLATMAMLDLDNSVLADVGNELAFRGKRLRNYTNYALGNTSAIKWGSVSSPASAIYPGILESERVRELIRYQAAKVRYSWVSMAGEWSGVEIVPDLMDRLNGPEPETDYSIKSEAIRALALIGSEQSLIAIEEQTICTNWESQFKTIGRCISALHIMLLADRLKVLPVLNRIVECMPDGIYKDDINNMIERGVK